MARNIGARVLLGALACLVATPLGTVGAQTVRLVQSVPEGTTLAAPGTENVVEIWRNLIERAERSIDLQGFYLTDEAGTVAAPFFEALRAAARRGVKVRILLDAKFFANNS